MKYKQLIEHKRSRISRLQEDLNETLESCPHEEDGESWLEEKSSYFGGSYYDAAYTDYWVQCKVCKKRSEITTVNHGGYG